MPDFDLATGLDGSPGIGHRIVKESPTGSVKSLRPADPSAGGRREWLLEVETLPLAPNEIVVRFPAQSRRVLDRNPLDFIEAHFTPATTELRREHRAWFAIAVIPAAVNCGCLSLSRCMWHQPRSLTNDEVCALTVFILAQNKLIDETDTISAADIAEGENAEPGRIIVRFPDAM